MTAPADAIVVIVLDVTAASRAHPMSKARGRGGRVPGFSVGVRKDMLVSSQPLRGGQASRRRSRHAAAAVSTTA